MLSHVLGSRPVCSRPQQPPGGNIQYACAVLLTVLGTSNCLFSPVRSTDSCCCDTAAIAHPRVPLTTVPGHSWHPRSQVVGFADIEHSGSGTGIMMSSHRIHSRPLLAFPKARVGIRRHPARGWIECPTRARQRVLERELLDPARRQTFILRARRQFRRVYSRSLKCLGLTIGTTMQKSKRPGVTDAATTTRAGSTSGRVRRNRRCDRRLRRHPGAADAEVCSLGPAAVLLPGQAAPCAPKMP